MKRKLLAVALFWAAFRGGSDLYAQFYTVLDRRNESFEIIPKNYISNQRVDTENDSVISPSGFSPDSIIPGSMELPLENASKEPVKKKHLAIFKTYEGLPGLTINNLLKEIRKNGIRHEKVVLAQAILETGWFTSSVCRNKNNLFGLTNPRTGQYYVFDHWTESVKAYYTKVQYRYKGGNYLLWLDEIGYAEEKTYVQLLIKLLNQYFI